MKNKRIRILVPIFSIICIFMLTHPTCVKAETGRILVVVDSGLLAQIAPSVNQYVEDLEFEGYSAVVVGYDMGAPTASPQDLRGILQTYYNEPDGLVGCFMIGELPIAYYESLERDFWGNWYWHFHPCDRYYMDMNGTWFDIDPEDGAFEAPPWGPCHAEPYCEVRPEIWLGRIPSSFIYEFLGFETEAGCVQNYFAKDHQYRTGQLSAIKYGALLFSDSGYQGEALCTDPWPAMLYFLGYDADHLTKKCSNTTKSMYLSELRAGHEHVTLFAHGNFNQHYLMGNSLFSDQLKDKEINTLFHTLESCRTGAYTYDDCIASTYLLSKGPDPDDPNHALTVLAPAWDSGSLYTLYNFFAPIREGHSWGEAVKNYFMEVVQAHEPGGLHFYLWNLLGDPTLKRSDYMNRKPLWIQTYDGPSNGDDRATDLWVRPNGKSFTVGYSHDSVGGYDIVTQKHDKNGGLMWEARWDSNKNRDDYAMAVAQSSGSGVFVVGATDTANNGLSWRVLKYSTSGTFKWKTQYNGPASKDDVAEDVAVDLDNNVFVAGWHTAYDDDVELVLQKYSASSKTPLWTRIFPIPARISSLIARSVHVEVDGVGNAYLAGTLEYYQGNPNTDYVVAKYSAGGALLWFKIYAGDGEDELRDLAVDWAGNAYITGRSTVQGGMQKMRTIKYDPEGNEVWQKLYAYSEDTWTWGDTIAVDPSGNVFVAADSLAGCHTVKYDSAGNELWARTYGGSELTKPRCMAADGAGNVVVAGEREINVYDAFTICYDGDGNLKWSSTYNGTGNLHDEATAVGVDSDNNIYITGFSFGASMSFDFATLKYQP